MRPTKHMFCILRYPSDGDGLVSQGFQNTALLGTSSVDVEDPDDNEPGMDEIKLMEDSLSEVVPASWMPERSVCVPVSGRFIQKDRRQAAR